MEVDAEVRFNENCCDITSILQKPGQEGQTNLLIPSTARGALQIEDQSIPPLTAKHCPR